MRQSQQAQPIRTGHYDVTAIQMHDAEGLAIKSGGRPGIVEQNHIAALRVQRFDLRNAVLGGELLDHMLQRRCVLANPVHGGQRRVITLILAAKRLSKNASQNLTGRPCRTSVKASESSRLSTPESQMVKVCALSCVSSVIIETWPRVPSPSQLYPFQASGP